MKIFDIFKKKEKDNNNVDDFISSYDNCDFNNFDSCYYKLDNINNYLEAYIRNNIAKFKIKKTQ